MRTTASRCAGFVLVPVVLVLAVVAAIAWALHRGGPANAALAGRTGAMERVREIAEAGLNHAAWRLAQLAACSGYTDIPSTPFGGGEYSVTIAQNSGSPVTLIAKASLPDGTRLALTRRVHKPVTTALTYTLQPGATGQDTYLEQLQPARNFGAADTMWLDAGYEHPMLRFDIAALPAGSRIQSAQLALYQASSGSGGAGDAVKLYRPLRAWTAGTGTGSGGSSPNGATWSTWDGTNAWATAGSGPGTDYDPVAVTSQPFVAGAGWKTWDVTTLARGWMQGLYPNDGVILVPTSGIANVKYSSSEATDATRRPKLVLVYLPPCGATNPPQDGEAGLVAHWKLDETSGGSAADATGGHSGALTGGTWATGVRSGGLALNGSADHVSVADAAALSMTEAITVMGWVRNDVLSGYNTIVTKGTTANVSNYWFGTNGAEIEFSFYDAGWRRFATSGAALQPGVWYHVAATFDSAARTVTVYLNGVQLLSASTPRTPVANTGGLTLGRSPSGEYWAGMLDDVRLYGKALAAAEIAAVMGARSLAATADTQLENDGNADRNYGSANTLELRTSGPARRVLAKFDVAGIPPGTTLQRATLRYHASSIGGRSGQPMTLAAHRVNETWVEGTQSGSSSTAGANWANRQVGPTTAWTSAGGAYDPTAAASTTLPAGHAQGQYIEFDLTALAQEWIDGVRANNGVILLAPGPETFVLSSREALNTRPQLVISW